MVVKVIKDALSDAKLVAFSELYEKKQVQALKDSEAKIWLEILEIFMWGKFEDYDGERGYQDFYIRPNTDSNRTELVNKPRLTSAQELKLRLLTLLTLASEPAVGANVKKEDLQLYIPNLAHRLRLSQNTEVANIFIMARQQDLLDGTIDHANQTLEIKAIYPARDLHPNEAGEMNSVLGLWIARAEEELKRLTVETDEIKGRALKRRELEAADEDRFEAAITESNKNNRKRGGASGNEGLDPGVGSSRNTRQR